MNFIVEHSLEYRYSDTVSLEPLVVRLCPRCDFTQKVESYHLEVVPAPAGTTLFIDAGGNNAQRIWFDGCHRKLQLTARTSASTRLENPFDFLLEPEANAIPFSYISADRQVLQPYLASLQLPSVRDLARRALDVSEGQTVPFLVGLCGIVNREIRLGTRPTGDPLRPDQTLRKKEGACRDLAVLFGEACRSIGIATRFVSGYAYHPVLPVPELHAWCEVYLPGAGWRGFDPSTGLAVDARYLVLATGPTYHEARPTHGKYRGTGRSRLTTKIQLNVV